MKRRKTKYVLGVLVTILFLSFWPRAVRADEKELTLMIYMCGSNLESIYSSATKDIEEIENSGFDTDKVNVLVMTGGASKWHTAFKSDGVNISLVTDKVTGKKSYGSANMGSPDTLVDFLHYGMEQYKAKKYALIFWDHGLGPLEGVCQDEVNEKDTLSIREITQGLEAVRMQEKLSWIGFDACLMASCEVAQAVAPFAQYMVASEEKEPGYGWDYSFVKGLEKDASGEETGRRIIDSYFAGHEDGFRLTLSCIDLSAVDALVESLDSFFTPLQQTIDETLFARLSNLRMGSETIGEAARGIEDGYDLVDLRSLLESYEQLGDNRKFLQAFEKAVVYSRSTEEGIHGLSIYHPLYNKTNFRDHWQDSYEELDFSPSYKKYIRAFGTMLSGGSSAEWEEGLRILSGEELEKEEADAQGSAFALPLTKEQKETFASAQLMVFGALSRDKNMGVYESQLSASAEGFTEEGEILFPVWSETAALGENGRVSAVYRNQSIYMADEKGNPVAGPISYKISDDGKYWYVYVRYRNENEDIGSPLGYARVLYTCALREGSQELEILSTEVFDDNTREYTPRITFEEEAYTAMYVDRLALQKPVAQESLPGSDRWDTSSAELELALPLKWHLCLFEEQLSGTVLYATLQVTDVYQNKYCTPLVRLRNPNLYDIEVSPRAVKTEGGEFRVYAVVDHSPISPGLSIGIEAESFDAQRHQLDISDILLNGERSTSIRSQRLAFGGTNVGPTDYEVFHISQTELIGIHELTTLSFEVDGERMDFQLKGASFPPSLEESLEALAIWEEDGISCELLDLQKNVRAGLTCLLHVRNNSDHKLFGDYYMAVNDRIVFGEGYYLSVEKHTDQYLSLDISDQTDFETGFLYGSGVRDPLRDDHLLEKAGIGEIQKLRLISEDTGRPSIELVLSTPFVFSEDPSFWKAQEKEPRYLLEDQVSVCLDRVMTGSDKLCLVLAIRNDSEEDSLVSIWAEAFEDQRPIKTRVNYAMVPAHAEGRYGFYWTPPEKRERWGEVTLRFSVNDYLSGEAQIRAPEGIPFDEKEKCFLSEEEYEVIPASLYFSGVKYRADHRLPEDIEALFSVRVTEEEYQNPYRVFRFLFEFTISNRSETVRTYTLDHFVINDRRSISGSVKIGELGPGETRTRAEEIRGEKLANLEEIQSFSCSLSYEEDGKERRIPLSWKLEGAGLQEMVFSQEELAAGKGEDGFSWTLVHVLEQEDWLGKEISTLWIVRNESGEAEEKRIKADILAGEFSLGSVSERLSAGMETVVTLEMENYADYPYDGNHYYYTVEGERQPLFYSGGLLQAAGWDEIEYFHIVEQGEKGEDGLIPVSGMVEVELSKPYVLSQSSEEERGNWGSGPLLLNEEAAVRASYLVSADESVVITLEMTNQTDTWQHLEVYNPMAGEQALEFHYSSDGEFDLSPGGAAAVSLSLLLPEGGEMPPSEGITLSFRIGENSYEGITVYSELPLLLGTGFLAQCGQLWVSGGREPARDLPLKYELGFMRYDCSEGEAHEFTPGDADLGETSEFDLYFPALQVKNEGGEDLPLSVTGLVNGKPVTWNRATVWENADHVFYYSGFEPAGTYDMTFYVNGAEALSGFLTLEGMYKAGFCEIGQDFVYNGNFLPLVCSMDDWEEGKNYLPTVRFKNSSLCDAPVHLCLSINGEDIWWDEIIISPGAWWYFYADGNYRRAEEYEMVLTVNGEEVLRETQRIRSWYQHHFLFPDFSVPAPEEEESEEKKEPPLCLCAEEFVDWYNDLVEILVKEGLMEFAEEEGGEWSEEDLDLYAKSLQVMKTETLGGTLVYDNWNWTLEMMWSDREEGTPPSPSLMMAVSMDGDLDPIGQAIVQYILAYALAGDREQEISDLAEWIDAKDFSLEKRRVFRNYLSVLKVGSYTQFLVYERAVLDQAEVEESWYQTHDRFYLDGYMANSELKLIPMVGGFQLKGLGKAGLLIQDEPVIYRTEYVLGPRSHCLYYMADESGKVILKVTPGKTYSLSLLVDGQEYVFQEFTKYMFGIGGGGRSE